MATAARWIDSRTEAPLSVTRGRTRIASVDIVRGAIMVLMALDHVRDYFTRLRIQPENLAQGSAPLFFTRWITHFCAPGFSFLAGVGIGLSMNRGKPAGAMSRFLVVRGIWLIFLELVVTAIGWQFGFKLVPAFALVLWALGWSMIVMAALVHLPRGVVAAGAVVMIATHNLFDSVFSGRPKVKTLIYVGLSHAAEAPVNGTDRMAGILKRLTKVDPLTIDQATVTDLTPETRRAYDLASAKIGKRSGILFDRGKPLVLGPYEGAVDLQVIHPRRAYRLGRPNWLAALGGRPVSIPKNPRPAAGRRLVQVFAANAPGDAVPLDQVMVTAGGAVPALFAPAVPLRFQSQQ